MIYRLLADLVLVTHFCFVVFTVFGGLLVLRRRWTAWLHFPAVVWASLIQFFWWACPLTTLENFLRQRGGEAGYAEGFIDYFVSFLLYTPLSPTLRFLLGFSLVAFNLAIYRCAFRGVKIR